MLTGGIKENVYTQLLYGRKCIHDEMRVTMATIYVRIPRNRWTPIGEIDLDGSQAAYYGRHGGPVHLYFDVQEAMRRAAPLTREIARYRRLHKVTTLHDEKMRKNRRYVQHIMALERRLRLVGPYRLLQEQAKHTTQKKGK